MSWNEIKQKEIVESIDIKKTNQVVTGVFIGSDEFQGKRGKQVVWQFRQKGGKPIGIYGFGHLNYLMRQVEIGKLVQVSYLGLEKDVKLKNGMIADTHKAKVAVWNGAIPKEFEQKKVEEKGAFVEEESFPASFDDDVTDDLPFA